MVEDRVREPIQTYLTGGERAELDRLARELGVSRSEILRRGIEALGVTGSRTGTLPDPLAALVGEGVVTLPRQALAVPETRPVVPLADLIEELRNDRDAR